MARPNYYTSYKGYGCGPSCEHDGDDCPNHPDLYLLRDAAADERGAIADYLECAFNACTQEVFLDVTEDEMQHYVETMRLIAYFDPVQAEMLEDENLDFLVLKRKLGKAKWKQMEHQDDGEPEVVMPDKRDIGKIRCLTKAIQDELHAINKYQQYMNQAKESEVKQHFCDLMNEEKEHVAEFTAALFAITHEPLPPEKE